MALFINGTGQDSFNIDGIDIDNLYVDGQLVFQKNVTETDSSILYTLVDNLIGGVTGSELIPNLGVGHGIYDGGLAYVGDGTSNEGDDFFPDTLYPQDGTIDLTMQADGKGSAYIDTYLDIYEARITQVAYDIVPGVSYKMYALYERGLGALDIYMGDSIDGYPDTPTYSINDYAPASDTLKITSELPDVIPVPDNQETSVYISLGSALGTPPTGVTITNISDVSIDTSHDIVDEDGVDVGMSISWTGEPLTSSSAVPAVSNPVDTGFLFNAQQYRYFFRNIGSGTTFTISGLNPAFTYDFEVTGSTNNPTYTTIYTMNGNATEVPVFENVDDGAIETGITGVTSFDILMERGNGDVCYIQGINIRRYS